MKQINTWNGYIRFLDKNNLGYHTSGQFVRWTKNGPNTGVFSAASHGCAREAAMQGYAIFGPAMRRWLNITPLREFPPGWSGGREPWRLMFLS